MSNMLSLAYFHIQQTQRNMRIHLKLCVFVFIYLSIYLSNIDGYKSVIHSPFGSNLVFPNC